MTNSIRPVVVASLLVNGEAQWTPCGTLPEWVQRFARSFAAVSLRDKTKPVS
jgi:hypothetical protein